MDTNSLIYNNSNNPGVSSFLGNVIDNLTSTSTLSSTLNGIPRKGKKVSGDLVSSSFASSSLGSDLLTITKSTQFVASCYFAPTNSTSTITKNVYVVGGGER